MIITRLELQHYRNHAQTMIECGAGINLITGPNGAGKTNLIDAIHYLCMSRSFVTSSDMYVLMQGESRLSIQAHIEGEIRQPFTLSCTYSRGEGKKFMVNDSPLDRLADLIGIVPVVVLSPDDRKITNDGPIERRAFLDAMISQASRRYLADLMDYRRIMKQRNRLLAQAFSARESIRPLLEPWNHQLAETGARIIRKRAEILDQFSTYLEQGYAHISGMVMKPGFEYKTICQPDLDADAVKAEFLKQLEDSYQKEAERGLTLTGPHRDDLIFYLDDMELRKFGSRGQHRLFALALKLAELQYFSDILDDLPVFLLDDVFGDLDPSKTEILTGLLQKHPGQSFITAANESPFKGLIRYDDGRNRKFEMEHGPKITTSD